MILERVATFVAPVLRAATLAASLGACGPIVDLADPDCGRAWNSVIAKVELAGGTADDGVVLAITETFRSCDLERWRAGYVALQQHPVTAGLQFFKMGPDEALALMCAGSMAESRACRGYEPD